MYVGVVNVLSRRSEQPRGEDPVADCSDFQTLPAHLNVCMYLCMYGRAYACMHVCKCVRMKTWAMYFWLYHV